jgi:hypothetical protein
MTKPQHPTNDWAFDPSAEDGFVDWFNGLYGPYSLLSEWFFGDCEIGDEKTRKDLMYGWLHAAYVSGYEAGSHLANRPQDAP